MMRVADSTLFVACALVASSLVLTAQQAPTADVERKGPQVGARVPAFSGVDQQGRTQTLESVLKADGAMLVFYRSADW
jgi:hypothetical protein